MPVNSAASRSLTFSTALVTPRPQILLVVAVAQFPCLVDAGAGPAGNGRPAERAVGQRHIDLDGRIAAAVENLSCLDIDDRTHGGPANGFGFVVDVTTSPTISRFAGDLASRRAANHILPDRAARLASGTIVAAIPGVARSARHRSPPLPGPVECASTITVWIASEPNCATFRRPSRSHPTMSVPESPPAVRPGACLEPMPPEITSTQPGGGVCYQHRTGLGPLAAVVSASGFGPGYVERMRHCGTAIRPAAASEILDPRDLKFCRNQTDCHWDAADDPFRWRERIPFARWGLAELQLMGWPLLAITVALAFSMVVFGDPFRSCVLCLIVYFFRDPPRHVPQEAGLLVAPADGKVVEVTQSGARRICRRAGGADRDFSVAVQRAYQSLAVCGARDSAAVFAGPIHQRLEPGLLDPQRMHVDRAGGRIGPAIGGSRCGRSPGRWRGGSFAICGRGRVVGRGEKFGMIKLGSRTELILPADGSWQLVRDVNSRASIESRGRARLVPSRR